MTRQFSSFCNRACVSSRRRNSTSWTHTRQRPSWRLKRLREICSPAAASPATPTLTSHTWTTPKVTRTKRRRTGCHDHKRSCAQVSWIDDILVVNQVQEQRRDQTQRSCPGRSKHHLNGHVQVGRSVHRFVRGGLKSDESTECFAPTGQQTLEATSSGGKALRATTNSPTWRTTTMLALDDRLSQQNNTKDFNIFKVLRYAAWAWDPGPLLQRVGLPKRHRIICLFSDQLWQHNDDCEGVLSRAEQKHSLDILLGARNLKPAEHEGLNELRQQFQPSSPDRQSRFSADRVHPEAPHLRCSPRLRFTSVYCELHDF
ncbi:uncharacterized protein LOC120427641 isoform X1 [Culex pipiens pallens]|uniref:uncharacterized protein LOC120427641 isoform X1 n=1 Tax=Culex pipiens pallens TaxID=42434 RepID=UPI0022AAC54B|nr:uncharacterized protein LOC120427641 isoform X1 [Culex pipiens pallens]XP_052562033.1 uncharacterized protein LOC120427641 isoform X1 [Culex pipiens pallens]